MDALALDQMLPEYEQKCLDVRSPGRNDSPSPVPPSEEVYEAEKLYEAEVGSKETVPVIDETVLQADSYAADGVFNQGRASKSSSSSSSSSSAQDTPSSIESASFYISSAMSPSISYGRDHPAQKLVAVFGRQFDRPDEIANSLQKLAAGVDATLIKFIPFTMKRTSLMKGSYNSAELLQHNLVCMCYNASEARILLTGTDGFYSALLRHTESVLGPNKVAFVITNFNRYKRGLDNDLISPDLRDRLYAQDPLKPYLDGNQVFSWLGEPSEAQLAKLVELAGLENNPQTFLGNQACTIL